MVTYVAYGLTINSDFRLPELSTVSETQDPDIEIHHERDLVPSERLDDGQQYYVESDALYRTSPLGDFVIRNGEEISADPADGVSMEAFRWALIGSAFNFLLHQRGYLVVHASAVRIDGHCAIFLGNSGEGKSTTAAALLEGGAILLNDDVAAVDMDGDTPVVQPGFPSIKLTQEVVDTLDIPLTDTGPHDSKLDRHFYRVPKTNRDVVELDCIYVLDQGEVPSIRRVGPKRGLVELIGHTYSVGIVESTDRTSPHFQLCAQVADRVPIRRLDRPRTFASLEKLVTVVLDDLQNA